MLQGYLHFVNCRQRLAHVLSDSMVYCYISRLDLLQLKCHACVTFLVTKREHTLKSTKHAHL
jgi:hypothetical protein